MNVRRSIGALACALACVSMWAGAASAQEAAQSLKPAFMFSDHAVLQREMSVPVWGQAAAGAAVAVSFGGHEAKTTADASGTWSLKLPAMPASTTPREMVITAGDERVVVKDLLVGEVWLCSGQSNMEKPIGAQRGQKPVVDAEKEIAAASHPQIRFIVIPKGAGPAVVAASQWTTTTPQSVDSETRKPSAVAYFFARELSAKLGGVPVGFISCSWGGTMIEPWTPPEGFDLIPGFAKLAAEARARRSSATTRGVNTRASGLYDLMVAPMVPYAIRGALWYQGESNVMTRDRGVYTDRMVALVEGWRKVWGQGDFPFFYVQLAPYNYSKRPNDSLSAEELPCLWEAQTAALTRIANSGMVVITDLVSDLRDIHPVQKREVGERLALLALDKTYGMNGVVSSGPTYRSVKLDGARAVLSFDHVGSGLVSRDGKPLTHFTLAGDDGVFHPATAVIEGDTVVVTSPAVSAAKHVRFGWHEAAMPNLANKQGLPAGPFRTDSLPIAPSPATRPSTQPSAQPAAR